MSLSRPLGTYPLAPHVKESLSKAGFETKADVISLTPLQLASETGISPEEALKVLKLIKEDRAKAGKSALEILQKKSSQAPIFTLSQKMDELLGGGVKIGEVTEFCGVPGVGKTQLGMQLACNVQIPALFGGTEGAAVYIDTEGSLMPERLAEIAQGLVDHTLAAVENGKADWLKAAQEVTVENLLRNIFLYRIYDDVEQQACIRALPEFLKTQPKVKLIIIDSVAFHFRRGFDDMALRARTLTGFAQSLLSLAEQFQLAVVCINQVTTRIDDLKGGHLAPALGESWAHSCTNRVMMHWSGDKRLATLLKSPSCAERTVPYVVRVGGIRDEEDEVSVSSEKRRAPEADVDQLLHDAEIVEGQIEEKKRLEAQGGFRPLSSLEPDAATPQRASGGKVPKVTPRSAPSRPGVR